MQAILETGGKQIKAMAGRFIDIEKLPPNKGDKVSLGNVLMLLSGKESKIGNPYVKGATVNGHIIETVKDDKIIVYKMRPKKRTRKKFGHRQWYTRVFIESIELDGKVLAKAEKPAPKAKTVVKAKAKREVKAGFKPASTKKEE
jgi:large subunit ribosomal protein L21